MKLTNQTDKTPVRDLYVFTGRETSLERKMIFTARKCFRNSVRRVLGRSLASSSHYDAIPLGLASELAALLSNKREARLLAK